MNLNKVLLRLDSKQGYNMTLQRMEETWSKESFENTSFMVTPFKRSEPKNEGDREGHIVDSWEVGKSAKQQQ